jgi:hypothetical protein
MSAEQLMSGESWSRFCQMLDMAGQVVLRDGAPDDPRSRSEGYRYLSRLTRAALEAFVEYADPRAPELRRMVHETVKMGADNPDNLYFNASISGAYRYKISGHRGSVRLLSFSTQKGTLGQGAGLPPTGALDGNEMQIDDDGRFEVIVACDKPTDGNWLPMQPDSGTLLARQTFADHAGEQPATLRIERIDGPHAAATMTPAIMAEALLKAGRMVGGAAAMFANWAEDFAKHPNELPRFDPELSTASGGDPRIAYYHGYWRLDPGEVLIIEVTPPTCAYWNFQLDNHWMESLDYRYHRVWLNNHDAKLEDDGSLRIIVAHDDPGHANWIDTTGLRRGTMCLRWVHADAHPEPRTRVEPSNAVE